MAARKNETPSLLPCPLSLFPSPSPSPSSALSSSSASPSSSSSSSIVRALVLLLSLSHFLMTSASDPVVTPLSDPNACDSFPCGPVGFSLLAEGGGKKKGYTCQCDHGFYQPDPRGPCEDIDECAGSDNPCKPGTCTNTLGDYFCACPSRYVESIDDGVRKCITDNHACKGRPCGPAGSCVPIPGGSYSCDCVPGFAPAVGTPGPCVEIEDPCTGNPCGPGGKCQRVLGGGYHCCCSPGYSLPKRFAHFGGKCVKAGN